MSLFPRSFPSLILDGRHSRCTALVQLIDGPIFPIQGFAFEPFACFSVFRPFHARNLSSPRPRVKAVHERCLVVYLINNVARPPCQQKAARNHKMRRLLRQSGCSSWTMHALTIILCISNTHRCFVAPGSTRWDNKGMTGISWDQPPFYNM